jgi:hypothetical protein
MSQPTEDKQPSLAEQAFAGLPAHTNDQATYQGQRGYWVQAEAKFVPCSNPGTAIAYYRQRLTAGDIAVDHNLGTACVGRIKLVAEHEGFRQQVATELAGLHKLAEQRDKVYDGVGPSEIEEMATRLGITVDTKPDHESA